MSTRWRRGKKKTFLTEHLPVAVSVFSFRIEEGRYGFEEEVAVSSTASIVTLPHLRALQIKSEHRIKTVVAVVNGP